MYARRALARYSDALDWGRLETWVYAGAFVSVLIVGLYGTLAGRGILTKIRPKAASAA